MSAIKYWLWLSTASRLSPKTQAALLKHYGTPENMYFAPLGEYKRLFGGDIAGLDELEMRDMDRALKIIDDCGQENIRIITRQDALYPDRLKNIYAPPAVLYVKGELPAVDDEAAIAVIGTRKATPYGIKMGRKLGYEIADCGGIVISGLTAGIDAAGAEGALRAGGRVIGVLGTSIESECRKLAMDVALSGALISEYPPHTETYKNHFRARNRIAAGLSLGVVVIEAPAQSGTRLFADEAAEQGKEIFAVPGNADAYNCIGTNALLKEGAKPVTDGWDIMCEFEALYHDKIKRGKGAPKEISEEQKEAEPAQICENKTKKEIDKRETADYIDLKKQLQGLSESQLKIVSVMESKSMHVDDIIEKSGFKPAKVLADLTLLQLQSIVIQEAGKRFTLNIKAK